MTSTRGGAHGRIPSFQPNTQHSEPPAINNPKAEIIRLVDQSFVLLKQFLVQNNETPNSAWETLVDVQEMLDQLRRLHPPRTFRAGHLKAL